MYKGKTQIILNNVKTGKKEVINSNNVFLADNIASFIRKLSNSAGVLGNATVSGRELYKTLVGGLFLFDKSIPTDSYMMPAGTKMIGNGSYNVVNNGVPRELGSWNDIESGVNGDEIKLVWDFTTSQANGTIKAVSLTSDLGGYIGMGNPSGEIASNLKSFALYGGASKPSNFENGQLLEYEGDKALFKSDLGYNKVKNGGTVTISIAKESFDEVSLLDTLSANPTGDFTQSLEISAVSDMLSDSGAFYGDFNLDDGKVMYLFHKQGSIAFESSTGYLEVDKPFYTLILDYINNSYELKELDNITGVRIYALYSSYGYLPVRGIMPLSEDEFLMWGKDNNLYYVDYNLNESFVVDKGNITQGTSNRTIITSIPFFNGLALSCASIACMFDAENKTMYPINCNYSETTAYRPYYFYDKENKVINSASYYYTNPFYLATINNITPVTKTDEQTMKVIYTLTKE